MGYSLFFLQGFLPFCWGVLGTTFSSMSFLLWLDEASASMGGSDLSWKSLVLQFGSQLTTKSGWCKDLLVPVPGVPSGSLNVKSPRILSREMFARESDPLKKWENFYINLGKWRNTLWFPTLLKSSVLVEFLWPTLRLQLCSRLLHRCWSLRSRPWALKLCQAMPKYFKANGFGHCKERKKGFWFVFVRLGFHTLWFF